jgi:hypothetical protein
MPVTRVRVRGKRWLGRCVVALLLGTGSACAYAQQPSSLLKAWLAFPNISDVAWPYSYIRADATQQSQQGARRDLFNEYKRLSWRLHDDGYPQLTSAVSAWQKRLAAIDKFRQPGDWSPSFLLSHVNQNPPISSIAAIGACDVPSTVTVWDATGVHALPWHSGMKLSTVEKAMPATRKGSAPEIAVVDPYGNIDHYGVQAWNYADGPVSPGTQVVASLPLKGAAFVWIRDAMAQLLAHSPSGNDCRERVLEKGGADD